jgi:hypothetical protein
MTSPDYSKSPGQVFAEFATSHIKQYGDLQILRFSVISEVRSEPSESTQPSWAPTWQLGGFTDATMHDLFCSPKNLQATFHLTTDPKISDVSGFIFDEIIGTRRLNHSDYQTWQDMIFDDEQTLYATGISLLQAYFRMIMYTEPLSPEDTDFWDCAAGFVVSLGMPFIRVY